MPLRGSLNTNVTSALPGPKTATQKKDRVFTPRRSTQDYITWFSQRQRCRNRHANPHREDSCMHYVQTDMSRGPRLTAPPLPSRLPFYPLRSRGHAHLHKQIILDKNFHQTKVNRINFCCQNKSHVLHRQGHYTSHISGIMYLKSLPIAAISRFPITFKKSLFCGQ